MNRNSRIYVAGHRGLVGSSIARKLAAGGYQHLLMLNRNELDLTDRSAVDRFFRDTRPEYVFLAAAKVGGIVANNTYPAEFIFENLLIQSHVIDASYRFGVTKLVCLGSSCIYPKYAPQPLEEKSLLSGALEPTNEPYAVAKIAGIVMARSYRRQYNMDAISLMPTNLYGPGDNFHPENSHVVPGLIRRFHAAKVDGASSVTVWGSGSPRREFLHVDDLADAVLFLMQTYSDEEIINVGTGEDVSISDLAGMVREVVGYPGAIRFDTSKPDGTPRKQLDVSKLHSLGWRAQKNLREGIEETYRWFVENYVNSEIHAVPVVC